MNFDLDLRPKVSTYNGQPAVTIETKIDGHRLTVVNRNGKLSAFSRTPGEDPFEKGLGQHDNIMQLLNDLPVDTVADGELYVPGEASTSVPNHLRTGEFLRFMPFAYPVWKGQSFVRRSWEEYWKAVPRPHEYLYSGRLGKVIDGPELKRQAARLGVEGFVLKNQPYDEWYKIKPIRTADVIVTDVTDGRGKYTGMIGALEMSAYKDGHLVGVGRCSGLSDEERAADPCVYLNQVIEVEYDSLTTHGKLRFAQFKRFRPDKPEKECLI